MQLSSICFSYCRKNQKTILILPTSSVSTAQRGACKNWGKGDFHYQRPCEDGLKAEERLGVVCMPAIPAIQEVDIQGSPVQGAG
jgi:hypothetical protein